MESKAKYFNEIKTLKLLARHEVGQNFLIDPDIAEKIVGLADIGPEDTVYEIGFGAGSLSYFIVAKPSHNVLADIDERFAIKLRGDFGDLENTEIRVENAMRSDLKGYTKIISNLPYYITSGLIERIVLDAPDVKKAVLMCQREVYSRLCAKEGDEGYSPLSIAIRYRATMKKEFNVSKDVFSPKPHVDSTVFTLTFDKEVPAKKGRKLYEFASKMFLHRRKTVYKNLQGMINDEDPKDEALEVLKKADIDPKKRPEELSLDDYLRLLFVLKK